MRPYGFTLIEILVAMTITSMTLVFVTYFSLNISNFGTDLNSRLESEYELQLALRTMSSEIRSMGPGSNGAYPIATATATTFMFYSDIDGDGSFEQVRYFLEGTVLKKGVTRATATEPILYPSASETIIEIAHYLTSTSLFSFFAEGHPDLIAPLATPVTLSQIRLVRVTGTVDRDTTQPPLPSTLTTSITIRNLRGEI